MTQTLTTEQLRVRAESLGLDFFIEQRAGVWVKEWNTGVCVTANAQEVEMWLLLANREAMPVLTGKFAGYGLYHAERDEFGSWLKATPQSDCSDAITKHGYVNVKLFTAPPAPAVPEEMTGGIAMSKYKVKKSNYVQWVKGFNSCRAAMLAQPVSSGYTLPEGWKLVPVEPTAEMINAALASGALSIRTAYRVMLAAAPEGGNDHDTRR
ncbi:hypothetical protein [Serratia entomophila]|uniref:hypothetical protein n=1 Tax=Serratia entomophila TaxID=42906 RepID=UPI00217A660D|nr:hypothetical protein [Serratia entomophila]CAI0846491.1 Uncharacterised protein [Serratia entomophila]